MSNFFASAGSWLDKVLGKLITFLKNVKWAELAEKLIAFVKKIWALPAMAFLKTRKGLAILGASVVAVLFLAFFTLQGGRVGEAEMVVENYLNALVNNRILEAMDYLSQNAISSYGGQLQAERGTIDFAMRMKLFSRRNGGIASISVGTKSKNEYGDRVIVTWKMKFNNGETEDGYYVVRRTDEGWKIN